MNFRRKNLLGRILIIIRVIMNDDVNVLVNDITIL